MDFRNAKGRLALQVSFLGKTGLDSAPYMEYSV